MSKLSRCKRFMFAHKCVIFIDISFFFRSARPNERTSDLCVRIYLSKSTSVVSSVTTFDSTPTHTRAQPASRYLLKSQPNAWRLGEDLSPQPTGTSQEQRLRRKEKNMQNFVVARKHTKPAAISNTSLHLRIHFQFHSQQRQEKEISFVCFPAQKKVTEKKRSLA